MLIILNKNLGTIKDKAKIFLKKNNIYNLKTTVKMKIEKKMTIAYFK